MKNYISTAFFILIISFTVQAQQKDEITIPFNGSEDQWVKVDVKYGKVNVIGTERSDVYIKWEKIVKNKSANQDRKDGLKRISTGESGLAIDQKDNMIEVSSSSFTSGYSITIEVPKQTNLDLSSFNAGDLAASNIEGTVSLDTYNGKITAHQMRGTVIANTFNGDILVEFDEITPAIPLEFVTYNGDVDITLPSQTKATLKMRTKGGEILSGFDIKMKKAEDLKANQKEGRDGSIRKVYLDGWIYGDLNGGGPEFELENNWGDIYIRKKAN